MLKVTAVDARTGEFVVFDSAGEAGLVDAVGASCAVPGVWPPVTIGNRRFMDGGVRSVANADLAARYERVVIVAPVAQGIGPLMPSPAGRRPRWPRPEPASRSCGRTARPSGPSGATCSTCRAGRQRRWPAGPRPRPKRRGPGRLAGLTRPAAGGPMTIPAIPGLTADRRHAPPVTAQNAQFGVAPPSLASDRRATHIRRNRALPDARTFTECDCGPSASSALPGGRCCLGGPPRGESGWGRVGRVRWPYG